MGKLLGNYLKQSRKLKRLTVKALSEITGISRSYIVYIENGEREPSEKSLYSLTNALELSFEDASKLQNEDKKNKILGSDIYKQNPCLSNSINKESQSLVNDIPSYYLNNTNNNFVSKKINFEDYTNILIKYLSDLNWNPCKDEDNSIVAASGDRKWLIECHFVDSDSFIDSEYVLKVLGRITFYLESPEKRYSIATNSSLLFQQLINKTPNALTEMLNLSYMLIEEKQKLSIVEMKNYFI